MFELNVRNWFRMGKTKEDRRFEILDGWLIDIQDRLRRLKSAGNKQDEVLQEILRTVNKIKSLPISQPKPLEVRFMFVVKDDHEPVNFRLELGDVTDAEGNVVTDAQLEVSVDSTDPSVVSMQFSEFERKGVLSFGNPGVASVAAKVMSGDRMLGSGAADFTVTVGDPAAISSVGLSFDGLTEAPASGSTGTTEPTP